MDLGRGPHTPIALRYSILSLLFFGLNYAYVRNVM